MMDTLQALPQPVIARVHALTTAAGAVPLRSGWPALQQQQVVSCRADNRAQHHAVIQRGKATLMGNSQCQQINIGDLVVAQHAGPIDKAVGPQGERVWPERMVKVGANRLKFVALGSDALLVQQIANMFGRDDFIACRERRVLDLHGHRLA